MTVTLTVEAGVSVLHLGADENRFSPDWLDAVEAALAQVSSGPPTALVTIADGKVYSNGLDLPWLMANPAQMTEYVDRIHGLLARMLTLPVPTVAAINGHAFGGGAMLALAHDMRVMRADRGFFCLPEADIRIPFTVGMVELLQAKMHPQAAAATMLTAARVPGPRAFELGIVDALTSEDELRSAAMAIAAERVGKDRRTLGLIKARMYAAAAAALTQPFVPAGEIPGLP